MILMCMVGRGAVGGGGKKTGDSLKE
jgi:hypothetical protein